MKQGHRVCVVFLYCQSNQLISSLCRKPNQKQYIQPVQLTKFSNKTEKLLPPHSSPTSLVHPPKRFRGLPITCKQKKCNKNPHLQQLSFETSILDLRREKISQHRAEPSSLTSCNRKFVTNNLITSTANSMEVISNFVDCDSNKTDHRVINERQKAKPYSRGVEHLSTSTPGVKPLEGNVLPASGIAVDKTLITPRFCLSPPYSPLSSHSYCSSDHKLSSIIQEVEAQSPQKLKCNSNSLPYIKRFPPYSDVCNSTSQQISPHGLTLQQRKYLEDLLSDIQPNSQDVLSS